MKSIKSFKLIDWLAFRRVQIEMNQNPKQSNKSSTGHEFSIDY